MMPERAPWIATELIDHRRLNLLAENICVELGTFRWYAGRNLTYNDAGNTLCLDDG